MPISQVCAVVLAAGQSKRFLSNYKSKLLAKLCGKELILYSLELLEHSKIKKTFVLGHDRHEICSLVSEHAKQTASFVYQEIQRGTGHALACSKDHWSRSMVLVVNGDMPLLSSRLIEQLINENFKSQADVSFVAFKAAYPGTYGRVMIDAESSKAKIVEYKDCSEREKQVDLVNAGLYLFKKEFLEKYIDALSDKNESGEFYLTDLIGLASDNGLKVEIIQAAEEEVLGVNTVADFLKAEAILRRKIIANLIESGVDFASPGNVCIDSTVEVGRNCTISSNVSLLGQTKIGQNCFIGANSVIQNSVLGDGCTVLENSILKNCQVFPCDQVGPFANFDGKAIKPAIAITEKIEILSL